MPDEVKQGVQADISQSAPEKAPQEKKKSKKAKLILLIVAILVLANLAVIFWFFLGGKTKTITYTSKKVATSTPQTTSSPANGLTFTNKQVIFTKYGSNKDQNNTNVDLAIYDLDTKKETNLTNSGSVKYIYKISPDNKKLAYLEYINDKESLSVYDFSSKKTNKLVEFQGTISASETKSIDDLVWKADSTQIGYLVLNRDPNDDPRILKKATIYTTDFSSNQKTFNLPLKEFPSLLVWPSDEIFLYDATDTGGSFSVRALNVNTKAITDKGTLMDDANALPDVYSSPDSKKIAVVSDELSVIKDLSSNQEVYRTTQNGIGWVGNGEGFIFYSKEESRPTKVSTYNFQTKETKSASFQALNLANVYEAHAYSNFSTILNAECSFNQTTKRDDCLPILLDLTTLSAIKPSFAPSTNKFILLENTTP